MPIDFEQLDRLKEEWKSLQPLPALNDERLWLKLRLEWNYHSNHIEGNTLTYKETELYLLRGQTSGVHVEREYTEMKGHDMAITIVRDLAKNPEELTEADIRNLNQILLKQSFYKDAITADGKPSRKEIVPGRYKIEPNSVLTATGQLFKYADPMDVPTRMAKLIEAIRKGANQEGLEFLATLAIAHHEFTLIHPFDDGNGRVARLVTNYALLKNGLPPIVIPSVRKTDYLKALGQADAGDPGLLADFFAEQLTWSLELGIKASKGESLEEPSDVEKEIALFVREQKSNKKQIIENRFEVIHRFLTNSVRSLGKKFDEKSKQFDELFESRELFLSVEGDLTDGMWSAGFHISDEIRIDRTPNRAELKLSLQGYVGKASRNFGISQEILIHLNEDSFSIEYYNAEVYRAAYGAGLTSQKIEEIISGFLKKLLHQIKQQAE